jgi:hypothetical protein
MTPPEKKPEGPLSNLTPKQQERLKSVGGSLQIDKITISHSIEERNRDGRKSSAFYSVTASRGTGAEINQLGNDHHQPVGYSPDDTKLARLLLSKHVVASVYDDAVKRGMMASSTAQEELRAVLTRYDNGIAKLLTVIEGDK